VLIASLQVARADVRLSGRVVDENSVAVPGAQVSLWVKSTDARPLQAVADVHGRFVFEVEAGGDYLLTAEREGYFRLQDRAVRLEDGSIEMTLVLNHTREVFERINVSYSPPDLDFEKTAPEKRLTGTQLLQIPYPTTNNLRNVMRAMPGIVQDARGGLHLHGGAEEQVLYTLDGFQINDPLTGRFEARMGVEAVRSMEVVTSNLPAEFGKGSAGMLALKTTAGDDRLRYSGTNFVPGIENRKGLVIGNWTPRFNVSGPIRKGRAWISDSLEVQYDKRIVEDLPKGRDRTASWRWGNLLRSQVNLAPSNIFSAALLVNYWNSPRNGLDVLDPLETTVDRRSRQWFLNFKDQIYLTNGTLIEAGFGANRTFAREIPQGPGPLDITPGGRRGNFFVNAARTAARDQWLANVFLPSFTAAGGHQLKAGIDVNRLGYWQDARRSGYRHYKADGSLVRSVIFGGNGRFGRSNSEASAYIQDSWKVRPGLLLELGLRQDWDRLVGNWNVAPRAGFAWSPPGLDSTKVSGGFAFIYDQTSLRLFTRPLDQYSLATYFDSSGEVVRGPAVSCFRIDGTPLASPRYRNWTIGLEQRIAGLYTRFGYVRRRGVEGFTYGSMLLEAESHPSFAAAFPSPVFDAIYTLRNLRRDVFDSFEVMVRRTFLQQYEWMASYTRSRALSNAVVDVNVDDPLIISSNVGRMPWDAPNRVVSWGFLPLFRRNWAVAYLLDVRDGFPFSIQDDDGRIKGDLNANRFPLFFELNLHIERRFFFRKNRWAFRAGFNNITNHKNPNVVNSNTSSPQFMTFYGGQSRALNFRIRWLGKN
jgi:hypothetical protein